VLATLPWAPGPAAASACSPTCTRKPWRFSLLIANTVNSVARLRLIVGGMTLMAVPIAFTGVRNFLSGAYIFAGEQSFGGPNHRLRVGADLQSQRPRADSQSHHPPRPRSRPEHARPLVRAVLLLSVGLQIVSVIVTFSRAGFLSLATILGTYVWTVARAAGTRVGVCGADCRRQRPALLPASYLTRLSTHHQHGGRRDRLGPGTIRAQVAAVHYVLAHPSSAPGWG